MAMTELLRSRLRLLHHRTLFSFNLSLQFVEDVLRDVAVLGGVEVADEFVDLVLKLLDVCELVAAVVLELHIVGHGLVVVVVDENAVLLFV